MDTKLEQVSAYLVRAVPTARAEETVGDVLGGLSGARFDSVHSVCIVGEDDRFVGVVPLVDLYAASADTPMSLLLQDGPPFVQPDVDREFAASLAIREGLAVVPVVDAEGRFMGVFPPGAIMAVLREEHFEDLHHLSGVLHSSDAARLALQAPPLRRARYRLPWLMIGLFGSLVAASVVAEFEEVLRSQIAVAFFIPAIVYLADAVGTQSETVAVRGLSLTDVGIRHLLVGEISAGAFIGLVLSLSVAAFAAIALGELELALTVGVSVFAACTLAASVGLYLPWCFTKAGWDPALASGPIATIIQDVLSLLIYFTAASLILG